MLQRCEDRLVMSAIPMFDLFHHDYETVADIQSIDSAPAVQPEVAPLLPVLNDHTNSRVINPDASSVTPLASVAHQQTGWDDVQRLFGLKGSGQTVAVIDSGVAWDHVALGGGFGPGYRVVGGWDFAESDSNPYDDRPAGFHGTHVAGIIGADDPTRSGVASGIDLVSLRVFDDAGRGQLAWVENALQWIHKNKNAFEFPITTVNLSLGSTWNSSTVPNWGNLEDEFQALRDDGIVVVASAGNSFKQYNTPGLSYPASSPLVIPVASVDADGSLSDFSQRNDRVIAAPGRSILSTVPDHFLGIDGIVNDWATVSGTSMAAPYVAGASVLIREAMQLAGWSSITPTGIYNWMVDTADSVFDKVTNASYERLNLSRAIGNLLPNDQVGDDWSSATSITLQNQFTTEGWNNTLGDRDVYRFTATSNGTVTLNAQSNTLTDSSWALWSDGQATSFDASSSKSFSVMAGQSYAIGFGDADQIGQYQLKWQFEPTNTASASGENSNGNGSTNASQFGIVQNGFNLRITGTSSFDSYQIDLTNGVRVEVDGKVFNYASGTIKDVNVDLKGGDDLLRVIGSNTSEKVDLNAVGGLIENASIKLSIINTEQIEFTGGGGYDRAFLLGSIGDDLLTARPRYAEMLGPGYRLQVADVERTYVDATQGGQDSAYFYDSIGNDRLSVRPQFTSMSGANFFNYAGGIERVYAYSNAGGFDSATLYDSAGSDKFFTSGDVASIVGPNFYSYTRFFEQVEAVSSVGGNDIAHVYANDGNSILVGSDFAGYQDSQWSRVVRGFAGVNTFVHNQLLNMRTFAVEGLAISEPTNSFSESPQVVSQGADFLVANILIEQFSTSMIDSNVMSVYESTIQRISDSTDSSRVVNSDAEVSDKDFVRLPDLVRLPIGEDYHRYESLLVDIDDEQRWLHAIFAAHGDECEASREARAY